MAVEDHIRVAASELTKAANVARTEIDQLRTKQAEIKRDRDKHIAQIVSYMGKLENEVSQADDSNSTSQARQNISHLQRELAERKTNGDDMIRAIDDDIKEKQKLIQSLESKSKSL